MIETGVLLGRRIDSAPASIAERQAVLEHFTALLERGTATVEEVASVTEPEPSGSGQTQ